MDPTKEIIKYPVLAEEWEDYVAAFTASLGRKPNPAGPPIAVFTLDDGNQIQVIKLDNPKELRPAGEAVYGAVSNRASVDIIARALKGSKPRDIFVIKMENGESKSTMIRLAAIRVPRKDASSSTGTASDVPDANEASALDGGVIHNPPYVNLNQQSNSATTDEK